MSGYSVVSYNLKSCMTCLLRVRDKKTTCPSSLNMALWSLKDCDHGADTLQPLWIIYYLYPCTLVLSIYTGPLSCLLVLWCPYNSPGPVSFSLNLYLCWRNAMTLEAMLLTRIRKKGDSYLLAASPAGLQHWAYRKMKCRKTPMRHNVRVTALHHMGEM